MDHRTTLRALGVAIITVLVLGSIVFQAYGGKSIVETLYEIFILVIGGLGAIAVQFMIWPERFLFKSAQLTNPSTITIAPKLIEDTQPLLEGEIFKSELLPRQKIFHRGDPVLFHIRMKGKLTHGYLAAFIRKADGIVEGVFEPSSIVNPLTGKGRLNGVVNIDKRWSWMIPIDGKIGAYKFFIHAGNHYPPSSLWVRIKAFGLHILGPNRTDLAKGTNSAIFGNPETVEVVE